MGTTRDDAEDRARGDVAAGFFDREVPDAQHFALTIWRKYRAHVASELGTFGDEIEGEQSDREDLKDRVGDRGTDIDGPRCEVLGELLRITALDELVAKVVEVDIEPVVVEPGLGIVDITRRILDELGHLI